MKTCDRCGANGAEKLVLMLAQDGDEHDCDTYYDQQLLLCKTCRVQTVDFLFELSDAIQTSLLSRS